MPEPTAVPAAPAPAFPAVPMPDPAASPPVAALLQLVQGNILRSHGRRFTRLLFFRFKRTDPANRAIFPAARRHAPPLVTSAAEQHAASPRRSGLTGTAFYGVALTADGLRACGYTGDGQSFPPEIGPAEFRNGVRADPTWDPLHRGSLGVVHGLWLLAHESDAELGRMENHVERLLRGTGSILGHEDGFLWCDPPPPDAPPGGRGPAREPFGFVDGISEPVFFADRPVHQPWVQTDLARVLIPDAGPHRGGSFLVFSKLDQNVRLFRSVEAALRPLPAGVRDGGALFIGRERDGTPLAATGPGGANDFDFEPAATGGVHSDRRCPFHAHIRKSNPRTLDPAVQTANASRQDIRRAQFVRRSVVYDRPPALGPRQLPVWAAPRYSEGHEPTGDVGLLFMACMRDIGEQFATLRDEWFHNPGFPLPATAHRDPLFGAPNQPWSWPSAAPTVALAQRPAFLRPRGDHYFYLPPIPWLENPPR